MNVHNEQMGGGDDDDDLLKEQSQINNPNINKENELNELSEIIAEYDRRLQEQVTLARQDVLVELEKTIQVSEHGSFVCYFI